MQDQATPSCNIEPSRGTAVEPQNCISPPYSLDNGVVYLERRTSRQDVSLRAKVIEVYGKVYAAHEQAKEAYATNAEIDRRNAMKCSKEEHTTNMTKAIAADRKVEDHKQRIADAQVVADQVSRVYGLPGTNSVMEGHLCRLAALSPGD